MLLKITSPQMPGSEVETDEDDLGVDLESFLVRGQVGTVITIEIIEED